jgi:hypothetical protein
MTMLFSQMIAILSKVSPTIGIGQQQDIDLITECVVFQSVPIRLAKATGLYHECLDHLADAGRNADDLETQWEEWVARETLKRTIVALYLLDSTIVSMTNALPTAQHPLNPLQQPSNDPVYRATTAAEWAFIRVTEPQVGEYSLGSLFSPFISGAPMPQSMTRFAYGALLEGIYSMLVIEIEGLRFGASLQEVSKLNYALDRFYAEYLVNNLEEVVLLLRWHAVCMTTNMARARIENTLSSRHVFATTAGRRAFLHANAVRQVIRTCVLTTVQSIILPVTLYNSATVLLDYTCYSNEDATNHLHLERSTDWTRIGLSQSMMARTSDETDHVQFLFDLEGPWTASISSLCLSTSDISPLIAVLGVMESVWTRCTTYLDALREHIQSME